MDLRPARAWALNLDADRELEDPSARTPSRAARERTIALASHVKDLLGPGDVMIPEGSTGGYEGLRGRAWCPTPGALEAIARAGAIRPAAPPFEVLRRVNHRRFCAELGQTLPGARWVTTRGELDAAIAAGPPGTRWAVKRPFSFAGRGRIVIAESGVSAVEARFIEASFAGGDGVQVEPWVERLGDYGLHGYVSAAGRIALGSVTEQACDARGAWRASRRAAPGALAEEEARALVRAAEEAGEALAGAGYFGPFGIDAFRYRASGGAIAWNPRCEINARYSMGWALGMGALRPDLDA